MNKLATILAATLAAGALTAHAEDADAKYKSHPNPVIKMDLPAGTIYCELYPDIAPKHAERILALTGRGFYDGVLFHRIVPGFCAQAGDPSSKKMAGVSPLPLTPDKTAVQGLGVMGSDLPDMPLEVSTKQTHTRGAWAMARKGMPVESANSQWYFALGDVHQLDNQYTVFGRVLGDGMDTVAKLKVGDPIKKMTVLKK